MVALEMKMSWESPGLRERDILEFRRRYPQKSHGKTKINWALACGGAAKFLIKADSVQGRRIKDGEISDDREHIDLDVYLFNNYDLEGKSKNPLDIFGVDCFGPLQCLDYEKYPGNFGFYVEVLKGFYHRFPLPTEDDVVKLRLNGQWFYSLSPEFVTASKLFSTLGIRDGIDDVDSGNLLKKFEFDIEYFKRLIRRTKFVNVLNEGDLDFLDLLIERERFKDYISHKIKTRYKNLLRDITNYNGLVSLLDYEPEYFENDVDARTLNKVNSIELKHSGVPPDNRLLSLRYLIHNFDPEYVRWCVRKFSDGELTSKHMDFMDIIMEDRPYNLGVGIYSELNQILTKFKEVGVGLGYSEEELHKGALYIARKVLLSEFTHVHLARYEKILDETGKHEDDYKEGEQFYEFMGELKL